MYNGLNEKYVAAVFTFGIPATTPINQNLTRYLAALGATAGTATNELAVIVPRDGALKSLYWSCQAPSGLTGSNNKITIYVNGVASSLESVWNGGVISGSNITEVIPVVKGDRVAVRVQLAAGGTSIAKLRASFELEVDDDYPNPWDYDPASKLISYADGDVEVNSTIRSMTGFEFPDGSVQTTAAFSGGIPGISESSGKIGIGIDPTRTPQEKLTLAPGSNLATEMPIPSGVSAAVSPTSGGLPMDDYFFRVTASDGIGWTKASVQLLYNLSDPDHGIRISWNPVLGATKYRVYRALTATGAYKYIEVTDTYYDYINDAAFTLTGSPPEETTAYINKLSAAGDSWLLGGKIGIGTTVPRAHLDVAGTIIHRNSESRGMDFAQRVVKVRGHHGNYTHCQLNVDFVAWASYTYRIQVGTVGQSWLQMGGGYINEPQNFSHVVNTDGGFAVSAPGGNAIRFDRGGSYIHPVCVFEIVGSGYVPIGDSHVSISFG